MLPMGDERPELHCDVALTQVFAILGKRWTGPILGALLERPARFRELAKAIPGLTESMLSARLGELQESGIVERSVIEGPPLATVYALTASGRDLEPALRALARWAERHMVSSEAPVTT